MKTNVPIAISKPCINGQWRKVDATWDKGLGDLFMINEWDGISDTTIAVPVEECFSPEESVKLTQIYKVRENLLGDLERNGAFYKAFNEWLAKNRT
jgi:hypothetical protein